MTRNDALSPTRDPLTGDADSSDTRALARARRENILEVVRERRDIPVRELCELTNSSPHAVRRDLRALEEQGQIRRTYGRVLALPRSLWELSLEERRMHFTETYATIAKAGAQELQDAETVFIDEGNLPAMVIPHLPTTRQLTIVTASLRTASSVAEETPHDVVMVGGNIRKRTMAAVGFWAREMLASLNIDVAFLGANGVSASKGLTTPDERVAQIKREAIRQSQRSVLLCAGSKFGIAQFVQFGTIQDIDVFVTDTGIAPQQRELIQASGALMRIAT